MTSDDLRDSIVSDLTSRYGHLVGGDGLRRALGYPTPEAFRQAVARGTVPVPVITVPGRRGKFALAIRLAEWLADQDAAASRAA